MGEGLNYLVNICIQIYFFIRWDMISFPLQNIYNWIDSESGSIINFSVTSI